MKTFNLKFARDVLHDIAPLLAAANATCRIETTGGGHARLVLDTRGGSRFTTLSCSPRNPDMARRQKTADVKRLLRELETRKEPA